MAPRSPSGWHSVGPVGASRDLWVDVTGEGRPEHGRWTTPAGLDVARTLAVSGPTALDVDVWWAQTEESHGTRRRDMLWQSGLGGFKLISERMVAVLREHGAALETFEVDVRLRRGERVEGYLGVLEECGSPGPVHSLRRGRRSHRFVVSEDVCAALLRAGLAGLRIESVPGPFPQDARGAADHDG